MLKTINTDDADDMNLTASEYFIQSLSLLEQVHRRLHDVVKDDLERGGERHLTGVQALILYEIGQSEAPDGGQRTRGAFAGTSLSYNVKKLQEGGYLIQTRSTVDRRAMHLQLTERGKKVFKRVEKLFERQAKALEPTASVRTEDLNQFNRTAIRLERFWADQIRFKM